VANVDYHQVVGQALKTLAGGLAPFVAQVLNRVLPPGTDWAQALKHKDAVAAGKANNRDYQNTDLQLMLRAMTERLGTLGYPFNGQMPRQAETYARELKDVRNKWAHTETFTAAEAHRAIETAELLLRASGATNHAATVAELKASLSPASTPPVQVASAEQPAPTEQAAAPEVSAPLSHSATIDITAIADLSYAMAHCRIPVIEQITVDNTGGDAHGAVLEIDVVSADGSHGGPREVHLDMGAHQQTVLREVNLKLDPASMLNVDEQRPGDIRAVLKNAAGEVLAEATKPVNILAANQWKAVPQQLAMELIAAHAQPNSAAIAALLLEVSDLLKTSTGNPSIDGYQSESPERVDAIARAVFDAMRARDIRYSEPPARRGPRRPPRHLPGHHPRHGRRSGAIRHQLHRLAAARPRHPWLLAHRRIARFGFYHRSRRRHQSRRPGAHRPGRDHHAHQPGFRADVRRRPTFAEGLGPA
jgi:hypothetical protein